VTAAEAPGADRVPLSRLVGSSGRRVPVPEDVAIGVTLSLLETIGSIHARDGSLGGRIAPEQVVVRFDGGVDLADETREALAYSAPERIEGLPTTHASDVYAASVIAWELLAGRMLFAGSNDGEVFGKVLHEPVLPPSLYSAGVRSVLDDIILRGVSRDPTKRFASAREMTRALESVAGGSPRSVVGGWVQELVGETRVTPPPDALRPASIPADKRSSRSARPAKRAPDSLAGRAAWVAASAVLLALAALAVRATSTKAAATSAHSPATSRVDDPTPSAVAAPIVASSAPPASASASGETAPPRAKTTGDTERRTPRPPSRTRPSPPPTSSASCYSLDSLGVWHVRPNCL
jgi:eukaryotic-like serine/threonine-protein kinase